MKLLQKKILLIILALFIGNILMAGKLVLVKTSNPEHAQQLVANPAFDVHYYSDAFVIATVSFAPKEEHIVLDEQAWQSEKSYYLVFIEQKEVQNYLSQKASNLNVLHTDKNFLIGSMDESVYGQLQPFKNDGLVRIQPTLVKLPDASAFSVSRILSPDPFTEQLIAQVVPQNITATVQHLQDYGTRNAYHPQSVAAQNWIRDQFLAMGLAVEVMDFNMPSGSASDNVIATLPGTKYPNEYIICGGHYDSYSNSSAAPGADDNASGTAGVMEIARIMSQYSFDRTIVFCAFSGEEYGLYGSAAYASRAANQGMNILGYYNLDMIGYLKPGNIALKTTLIYPSFAQPLATFYTEVCSTYLPQLIVQPGFLSGGDSDHTSFNNNGFMGIFPFEAVPDYSPYIHTSNDIVGLSYNSAVQAGVFTQASLAAMITMANQLKAPAQFSALAGDRMVELNWGEIPDAAGFNIYRDNQLLATTTNNRYFDLEVQNGTPYIYYATAFYGAEGIESSPSNAVTVIPMPPMALPLMIDFEAGAPYWEFTDTWGLTTVQSYSPSHSISESPTGNYGNGVVSYAYLRPFNLSLGFTSANLSFRTRYDLEANYDYMYLEATTNGNNWTSIATFNGTQNSWQLKTYSLNSYIGQPYVQLRFRFTSDNSVVKDGMYIDDFEISTVGGFLAQNTLLYAGWNSLSSYVVPAETELSALFSPLNGNLIAVQTLDGIYLPQQGINTIGNWNALKGYKIKVENPTSFTIAGLTEASNTINITEGWNLIPVLSDCEVQLVELLQNVGNQVIIVKETGSNNVYWPSEGITGLQALSPGKAYLLKSTQSFSLQFPPCRTQKMSALTENLNNAVTVTANTHVIALAAGTLDFAFSGDEIFAFTQAGLAAGKRAIDNPLQAHSIALFGNDTLSSVTDGFGDGEAVSLKLRQQSTGFYYDLLAAYDASLPNQGTYSHEGLSRIISLVPDATGLEEISNMLQVFPNPAETTLNIIFESNLPVTIELYSTDGKKLMQTEIKSRLLLDVSALSPGVYFIKAKVGDRIILKRFVKLKS
ncbi:MAG: M28 family peptidase [Bacteroidales bacterium]|nr:M28 family peptidase [Bacteroidales bacterium]